MSGLHFTDVTLRDGLQIEKKILTLDQKLALFERLVQCGFNRIEVTSFVNPAKVPQFADAEKFCEALGKKSDLPELMAFVPNEKGFERLARFPIDWTACFVSCSEAFNRKNVNASVEESLEQVRLVINKAKHLGRKVRVYVSTVFGCPYAGEIALDTVSKVVREVANASPDEVALGDTIGVATPDQVRAVLSHTAPLYPLERTALHLHNTYGLAVAAAQAGWQSGVRRFDGATGGVGGCPYAKGASGNVASEDLIYSFFRQGITRFQEAPLKQAVQTLSQELGLIPQGRLSEIWAKGGSLFGV